MKRIFLIFFIVVAISGLLYYLFPREKGEGGLFIKISGNIEATEADVGFKIVGRIVSLSAQEGDWVEKGKVLAKLDDEDLRQRLELARATLKSAQARLSKLLAGSRPEEVREAEANLNQARFELENKQTQYERMKALFERRVIPKETLDNVETGYKVAKASLQRAMENYQLVKEGPRKEDIEEAKAQVDQAKASLKLAETQLSYTVLYSPISGVVLVKSAEIGEVVNPGTSVLTLADIENVWLKAYIPETDLSKVKWVFQVPLRGSITLLYFLSSIYIVVALAMGLTISTIARTQLQANQMAIIIGFLPTFLLSGFTFIISNMPIWLQVITYGIAPRYYVTILKEIFLKGTDISFLLNETFVLIGMGIAGLWVATRSFKKELR